MGNVDDYLATGSAHTAAAPAPALAYLPRRPVSYNPPIGLIGAGGISEFHLKNYRSLGLNVVAICDLHRARAESRRNAFYPDARVYERHADLLARDDIEVVDIATHPAERVALIEDAIAAHKHILSQKPFVTDLVTGEHLADLADARGVKLAVNQNGRFAPHYRYIHAAIRAGILGEIASIDCVQQWDHTWTAGTPFEDIHHLILYDFAIHWFDLTTHFMNGRTARHVYAATARARFQKVKPPFLAHVVVDYGDAQARLLFNAHAPFGPEDRTIVCGEKGTIRAWGPGCNDQEVALWTKAGRAQPPLEGTWFTNGFQGTMLELLCAIEENREPSHSARNNLASLALCFAAIRSADTGSPQVPGTVRSL